MQHHMQTIKCHWCNAEIAMETLSKGKLYELKRTGRAYCGPICSMAYRKKISSETMAKTNRKYASERMRIRNPMRVEAWKKKAKETLKRIGHKPIVRGGNGSGPTVPQRTLYSLLGEGWFMEHIMLTPRPPKPEYPHHYKIDIANPELMVAVEVDGGSHDSLDRKAQDLKKDALMKSQGWLVLRVKNSFVMEDPPQAAAYVMSSILKWKTHTTISQKGF